MAGVDTPIAPPRRRGTNPIVQGLAGVAILALLGFIAVKGYALYGELRSLREQQVRTNRSAIVGYVDIHVEPNNARRPADWFHDEGEQTLLWAGWKEGKHDWFRIGRGELEKGQISMPMGRDVIRAIDQTIVERDGGPHWVKVPDTALVAGIRRAGVRVVYPILVLSKVEVVNDRIGEESVLIVYRPFLPDRQAVSAFAPIVDGRRITMGLSGYLLNKQPLLYDRGTRSLWREQDGVLGAIAGPLKGTSLPAIEGVEILPWSDCRSRYPESRLVVGADRSNPRPEL